MLEIRGWGDKPVSSNKFLVLEQKLGEYLKKINFSATCITH
jgi:hypothetical protein